MERFIQHWSADFGDAFTLADIEGTRTSRIDIEGLAPQTVDISDLLGGSVPEATPYPIEDDTLTYVFGGTSFSFTRVRD